MKKAADKSQQHRKLITRRETIANLTFLTRPQLEGVVGGSGSSTNPECEPPS
jgi:hypothetical protein